MKSILDTIVEADAKKAPIRESRTQPKEMYNYISNWLYECRNIKELKMMFESIVGGLNHGLDELNEYNAENVEVCEAASEIIEQLEVICKNTLK